MIEADTYQDQIKAYRTLVHEVVLLMKPESDQMQLQKHTEDLINFEIKLASAASSAEQRRNVTALYNPFTVEELQAFVDDKATTGKVIIQEIFVSNPSSTQSISHRLIFWSSSTKFGTTLLRFQSQRN